MVGLEKQSSNKTIDKNIYIPFGLEIETENIPFDEGLRVLRHKVSDKWIIGDDRSLDRGGMELSSPIITNVKESFIALKKIAETLKYLNATYDHASLQVNLDALKFTKDDIIYLLKIFSVYENIIYRFSSGEDEFIRSCVNLHASPLGRLFKERHNRNSLDSYCIFINNKSYALSLKTKTINEKDPIKVIEFRTPNGTSNYYLWMNYIIFFSSFLKCIEKKKYDKEYIDYLFNEGCLVDSLNEYNVIDEKKAIEFADLIYQDNIEKDYFYNQYFDKIIKKR